MTALPTRHTNIAAIGEALFTAQLDGGRVSAPSATMPGLDLDGAYAIQRSLVQRRITAGERPIGWKVGMSSIVGRAPGSPGPIYGRLLSGMAVEPGGSLDAERLHEPHVEGEVALVIDKPLRGPRVTTTAVLAAVGGALPAIEVFARRIDAGASDIVDIVADNALSAHVVFGGPPVPCDALDLRLIGLVLRRDGDILATGAGAQALGHPAQSVAWLANALAQHDQQLAPGDIVLTGALAGAHPAHTAETFTADLDRLGSVSVRFT